MVSGDCRRSRNFTGDDLLLLWWSPSASDFLMDFGVGDGVAPSRSRTFSFFRFECFDFEVGDGVAEPRPIDEGDRSIFGVNLGVGDGVMLFRGFSRFRNLASGVGEDVAVSRGLFVPEEDEVLSRGGSKWDDVEFKVELFAGFGAKLPRGEDDRFSGGANRELEFRCAEATPPWGDSRPPRLLPRASFCIFFAELLLVPLLRFVDEDDRLLLPSLLILVL